MTLAYRVLVVTAIFARCATAQDIGIGSQPLRRALQAAAFSDDGRIAQGVPVSIKQVPWQVALVATAIATNTKAQFCGGAIIGRRWVLTAAHCVDEGTKPEQVAVLTGTDSLINGGQRLLLAPNGITIHAKWQPSSHDFDVALLQTAEDISGSDIGAVPATASESSPGETVTISGWGRLAFTAAAGSQILLSAEVKYVATDICNRRASYGGKITKNMFCAGYEEGRIDACRGDSGGPATVQFGSEARLIGIISWGEGCGSPKKYGVYSKVSQFRTWVIDQTSGAVRW